MFQNLEIETLDVLNELSLKSSEIEECRKYLKHEISRIDLFSCLPEVDFHSLSYKARQRLFKHYKLLQEKNEETYLDQYMDLLTVILGYSLLECFNPFVGYSPISMLKEFSKYSILRKQLVVWCAERLVKNEGYILPVVFQYFDKVFQENEEILIEALEVCSTNAKGYAAAFLISKDPRKHKNLRKWLEAVLKNSLEPLFDACNGSKGVILSMNKYVQGGLFVQDSMVETIKQELKMEKVNSYILKILLNISFIMFNQSKIARRFFKLTILLDFNLSLDYLYAFLSQVNGTKGEEKTHEEIKNFIKKIDGNDVLYIAWMGNKAFNENVAFDSFLSKEYAKDENKFKKAMNKANKEGFVYLSKFLAGQEIGKETVDVVEETYLNFFENFFEQIELPKNIYVHYLEYLGGEKEFEDIEEYAAKLNSKKYHGIYALKSFFAKSIWLKEVSPMFKRTLRLLAYGNSADFLVAIAREYLKDKENSFREFLDLIHTSGVDDGRMAVLTGEFLVIFKAFSNVKPYQQYLEACKEYLSELIHEHSEDIVYNLEFCSAQGRELLLTELFHSDQGKYAHVLTQHIGDSSKTVRNKMISLLGNYPKAKDHVIPLLTSKKRRVREGAVHILSIWKDEDSINALNNALDTESSNELKSLILSNLNLSANSMLDNEGDINILDYCKRELARLRGASISWINMDSLPSVRYQKGEDIADRDIIKYLMACYGTNNSIAFNREAQKVSAFLNREDLADLSLEILNQWLADDAKTKRKWVLGFSSIHGDERVVMILEKKIKEWPKNARGTIASEAVRALALSGRDSALMLIDSLARQFKYRQVKKAASEAFEFAAKELGVNTEELTDRIIPKLGFDSRGMRIFDYGSRKLTVRLGVDLGLQIFNESEMRLKSFPDPGKNDDEEKSRLAWEEFKLVKKQLKTINKMQTVRLETVLAVDKRWTKEAWEGLFVHNPLMHPFAIGLIWGVYLDGELSQSFRYMEDGTYNTVQEDEYEIPYGTSIGLLHPVDMDQDDINNWIQQIQDYEIVQPVEQLKRKVFKVSGEEVGLPKVERFGGIKINGLSFVGKLSKFGWFRGSVMDGGRYNTFSKEFRDLGMGAQIEFSGLSIGYEDEEITLDELVFYDKGKMIKPIDVPKRLFSEILYDLDRATVSKTGLDEHWKKKK